MKPGYIPKLGNFHQNLPGSGPLNGPGANPFAGVAKASFKDVLGQTVGSVNQTVQAPDQMLHEAVVNGTYDVHDVMLANAKADLAVTLTSQFTTKVVQAYDKILQIQI